MDVSQHFEYLYIFEAVQLTNPDFPDLDMFDKFIYICINAQKSLGKFLSKALAIRTELMFSSSLLEFVLLLCKFTVFILLNLI